MLLVRDDGPHLLSLLLLRGDAGLQVRRPRADLPPAHSGVHTQNSDIPGQLHRSQNKGEHPSVRVIIMSFLFRKFSLSCGVGGGFYPNQGTVLCTYIL